MKRIIRKTRLTDEQAKQNDLVRDQVAKEFPAEKVILRKPVWVPAKLNVKPEKTYKPNPHLPGEKI